MPRQVKSSTTSDVFNIESAKKDPAEFEKLYRVYVQPVFKYLYSRVGNKHDAEELTSQTFLAAFERLPGYHNNGHFPAWLFSIARNKSVDFYRKRGRVPELELQDDMPGESDSGVENRNADRIQSIAKRIGALSARERELLRLRFVADLSFGEIAALQGRTLDAVKKQVYRLLARLHAEMEADDE